MRECFDIVLDSQLGERRGTLTIDETGGAVRGAILLVGFENAVAGEERPACFIFATSFKRW